MSGLVMVAINLKPRKMIDFMSNGMVLCARSTDGKKVELLRPDSSNINIRYEWNMNEKLFFKKMNKFINNI